MTKRIIECAAKCGELCAVVIGVLWCATALASGITTSGNMAAGTPSMTDRKNGECLTEFLTVDEAHSACGYSLAPNGVLTQTGRVLANPFVVTFEDGASGRRAIRAERVRLFPPSPGDRYRVIQGCQSSANDAICWAVRVVNEVTGRMREVYAGRYGPEAWQRWSPSGRRVLLFSRSQSASWLYVVDTTGGKTRTYPHLHSNENWAIQRDTAHWITSRSFSVVVRTCESCGVERMTFQF